MSGGGKGGSAPAAPDYLALASKQGDINANAARLGTQLSRVNQVTPYGSVTYRQPGGQAAPGSAPSGSVPLSGSPALGGTLGNNLATALRASPTGAPPSTGTSATAVQPSDQWEQVTTLSPEQQQLFDINQGNQINLGQTASSRLGQIANQGTFDISGLPDQVSNVQAGSLPNPNDFSGDRQKVEDALYGRSTADLDPQFQQSGDALRTRLLNSGIREGSDAWNTEMGNFDRSKSNAYENARDQAILAGGNEQSRMLADALSTQGQQFSQGQSNAALENTSRAQGLQELLTQRGLPLQEFMSLYGGAQPNVPNAGVGGSQSVTPYDLMGAANQAYQGQLSAYNANQAANSGLLGSLLGLGGTLGGAAILAPALSDERAKENIEPIGELPQGVGLYEYEYKGDPTNTRHTGVLAQELEKVQPDAVLMGKDGYRRVNYAKVIGLAKALREAA